MLTTNFLLALVLLLAVSTVFVQADSYSQRRRRTKELDEKITKLDDGTKQRIFAMKASGMPHDAIAEKISYQAGGKTTAKRIVDAMLEDPVTRKPGTKKTAFSSTPQKKTQPAAKSSPKKTGKK